MSREVLSCALLYLLSLFASTCYQVNSSVLAEDCLEFDIMEFEGYLSKLNLQNVPSVHTMIGGFKCPITALPFGALKSDWARLLLLQNAQPEGSLLKNKLLRLFRVLVFAYYHMEEHFDSSSNSGNTSLETNSTWITAEVREFHKHFGNMHKDETQNRSGILASTTPIHEASAEKTIKEYHKATSSSTLSTLPALNGTLSFIQNVYTSESNQPATIDKSTSDDQESSSKNDTTVNMDVSTSEYVDIELETTELRSTTKFSIEGNTVGANETLKDVKSSTDPSLPDFSFTTKTLTNAEPPKYFQTKMSSITEVTSVPSTVHKHETLNDLKLSTLPSKSMKASTNSELLDLFQTNRLSVFRNNTTPSTINNHETLDDHKSTTSLSESMNSTLNVELSTYLQTSKSTPFMKSTITPTNVEWSEYSQTNSSSINRGNSVPSNSFSTSIKTSTNVESTEHFQTSVSSVTEDNSILSTLYAPETSVLNSFNVTKLPKSLRDKVEKFTSKISTETSTQTSKFSHLFPATEYEEGGHASTEGAKREGKGEKEDARKINNESYEYDILDNEVDRPLKSGPKNYNDREGVKTSGTSGMDIQLITTSNPAIHRIVSIFANATSLNGTKDVEVDSTTESHIVRHKEASVDQERSQQAFKERFADHVTKNIFQTFKYDSISLDRLHGDPVRIIRPPILKRPPASNELWRRAFTKRKVSTTMTISPKSLLDHKEGLYEFNSGPTKTRKRGSLNSDTEKNFRWFYKVGRVNQANSGVHVHRPADINIDCKTPRERK